MQPQKLGFLALIATLTIATPKGALFAIEAATVTDRLDSSSEVMENDNTYYNVHTFEGEEGEQIIIELVSEDFDSYLLLLDSEFNKIAANDDGGEGKNATIIVTLPKTGDYVIIANAYGEGEMGEYRLSWRNATSRDITQAQAQKLLDEGMQLYREGSAESLRAAIEKWEAVLVLWREVGNTAEKATILAGIGLIYSDLEDQEQALDYYNQALSSYRVLGDRKGVAVTLKNIGLIYSDLGNQEQALEYYDQSLHLFRAVGDRAGEAITLNNIGHIFQNLNQPELAIIFLKQSVNTYESLRKDITQLDTDLQQTYTDSVSDTYRRLADLLLQQDRILEAQRVLDLLKVQELEEYLENVRGSEDSAEGIPQRTQESNVTQGYNAILDQAIELGKELVQLAQIPVNDRIEAQRQRILELRKAEEQIIKNFQAFLDSPEVQAWIDQLRRNTDGQAFDLENYARNLQDDLQQINASILYPLILNERLELMLMTPHAPPIRRTVQVSREDLNQAILDYRRLIENRGDPQETQQAAQTLYNYLIKPLENDLATADTPSILYAPDGQLRYIPLAALHDGSQWLVERYRVNNITAVSLTDLTKAPNRQLSILAGAFTDRNSTISLGERDFNFNALPYAKVEVERLADTIPNTTTRLGAAFSPDIRGEANDYSIVHLATHAHFLDNKDSFILFNDARKQTLEDMGSWNLTNVDLIVLSACQTALGDILGDGTEILGFGYQMQTVGARATLASLWNVSDGGTQVLMNTFYAALANNPNLTKAEALQQAQIALITGDESVLGGERTPRVDLAENASPPEFRGNLSSPYYWSSFILIGNGL